MSNPAFSPTGNEPNPLSWWTHARFGMSLHLGLYSVLGRGEWVQTVEGISEANYALLLRDFAPEIGWAETWARNARLAGAQYAVLTTKHHDGFCLFESGLTDFHAGNSAAGRDLVKEWVNAVRAEGLRVGLYYSLIDWHHPDYPAAGDRQHPLRNHPDVLKRDAACDWDRYLSYMHGQLVELCTNYGRVDSLVVDFSYGEYSGEKWGATDIQNKLRKLQPGILFNDRWGREPRKRFPRPSYAGDYEQTEQNLPREALKDDSGAEMPWEGWFTLTNSWSFSATDACWKTPACVIRSLVNCVSKNGNLLLNVSPDARGRIPREAELVLREVGEWMTLNGESIRGAGGAPFPKPEWGRYTMRGNKLYAHILEPVVGHISLPGLRDRVAGGRLLATNSEVILTDFWNPDVQTFDDPEDIFFNFANPVSSTYLCPDPRDCVVAFDLVHSDARSGEAGPGSSRDTCSKS